MGAGWVRMRIRCPDVGAAAARADLAESEKRGVGVGMGMGVGEDSGMKGGSEEAMDQEGLMGYWDLNGCVNVSISERPGCYISSQA